MYMRKNAKNCKLHTRKNPGRKLLGSMRKKAKNATKNIVFIMQKCGKFKMYIRKRAKNVNKCNLQFFRFFRIDIWDFSHFYLINTMFFGIFRFFSPIS